MVRGALVIVFTFAVVSVAIALFRAPLRSWCRQKKGLCVKCAYDPTVNVSGVCPECGSTISETPEPAHEL